MASFPKPALTAVGRVSNESSGDDERLRLLRSPHLSQREWEIVTLIVILSKSNKEIANDLNLTEGTVKEYLNRLFNKLGLNMRNRGSLALWWSRYGTRTCPR